MPAPVIGGIWLGLLAAFAYGAIGGGIPSSVGLFRADLFMSLGWSFLPYACDPPFGDTPVLGILFPG